MKQLLLFHIYFLIIYFTYLFFYLSVFLLIDLFGLIKVVGRSANAHGVKNPVLKIRQRKREQQAKTVHVVLR
jgi:hypothetical protein